MNNQEIMVTLIPLNKDELSNVSLYNVRALYQDNRSGIINVGRPSIAAYKPIIGNMFGYSSSNNKGYYLMLDEEVILSDKPIYQVKISKDATVTSVKKINDVEYNDVLSSFLKNNQRKI